MTVPAKTYLAILALFLMALARDPVAAQTEYLSDDGKVVLETAEHFDKVRNPHAILSLQTEDEIVVLVTSEKKKFTVTQLYDGLPSTFGDGIVCEGRVLLSVDGEQAPTFLLDGMFPPGEEATHKTLYAVANHGDRQYTFMFHFPKEQGEAGFEWATGLLDEFRWREAATKKQR